MRHRRKKRLSGSRSLRRAQIKSLIRALLIYERIKTTTRKAKLAAAEVERLISRGKKGDLASRRIAYSILGDHKLVKKLFEDIAVRFKEIPGGYTRVINLDSRKGDGADLSILELTLLKEKPKKKKKKEKAEQVVSPEHRPSLKEAPKKTYPPKGGFRQALKKIFKKERDAL